MCSVPETEALLFSSRISEKLLSINLAVNEEYLSSQEASRAVESARQKGGFYFCAVDIGVALMHLPYHDTNVIHFR